MVLVLRVAKLETPPQTHDFFWFPHNTHTFPPFQFTRFYLHNISSVTPQARRKLENEQAFMRFESMKQRKMCVSCTLLLPPLMLELANRIKLLYVIVYFVVFLRPKFIWVCTLFMFLKLAPAERKPIKSKVVMYMHQQKTATWRHWRPINGTLLRESF